MKRRPPSAAMSLFSYLDGLVCTMGALILLLLMTTQKIRDQVIAEHTAKQASVAQAAAASAPALPVFIDPISEEDVAERKARIAREVAAYQKALEEHQAEEREKHAAWNRKLSDLASLNQRTAAEISEARSRVESSSAAAAQAEGEQARLQSMVSMAAQSGSQVKSTEKELQDQAAALLQQREQSLKKIEEAKVRSALRNPVFEIETKESISGTTRRPILIEVTPDSLVFVSEGISISASTLNDFTPNMNPLLAGTEALLNYWREVDRKEGRGKPGPYVLMIVRPGGTVGFYVARKYLEKLGEDFGYELVPATAEFRWPPGDPQAKAECQAAIDRMMNAPKPQQLKMGTAFKNGKGVNGQTGNSRQGSQGGDGSGGPGGQSGEEQIVGSEGEFSLAEVEQAKNWRTRDSIGMLGPEWDRKSGRTNAAGTGTSTGGGHNGEGRGSTGTTARTGMPGRSGGSGGLDLTSPPGGSAGEGQVGESSQAGEYRRTDNGMGNTSFGGESRAMTQNDFSSSGDAERNDNMSENGTSQSPGAAEQLNRQQSSPASQSDFRSMSTNGQASSEPDYNRSRERQLPPPPLVVVPHSKKFKNDGGVDRKWGRRQSNGTIGFEKDIKLHLYPDRVVIDAGAAMALPDEISREELQDRVAMLIDSHCQTWGDPPKNFIWRPTFQVTVHPGGQKHYLRLRELFDHWGMNYKAEFAKE